MFMFYFNEEISVTYISMLASFKYRMFYYVLIILFLCVHSLLSLCFFDYLNIILARKRNILQLLQY